MDAIKLLKGLLGNKSVSSSLGKKLLGSVFGGRSRQPAGQPAEQSRQSQPAPGSDLFKDDSESQMGGLFKKLSGRGQSESSNAGSGRASVDAFSESGSAGKLAAEAAFEGATQESDEQDTAKLFIRAMINAAKADGRVDREESDNIIQQLGEVSKDEMEFLRSEFNSAINIDSFVENIPTGMEQQVYAISLTAIDLDTQHEARYLNDLAQALKLSPEQCNQIHDQMDAPRIYS